MSVTAPQGFLAAGGRAGLKPDGSPDLALVATTARAAVPAAGVFTTNLAAAAPVRSSRAHLRSTGGRAAAVLVNSGNANAATGARGRCDSERACELTAREIGVLADEVLVCSTGVIGIPLPSGLLEAAVPGLVAEAAPTRAAAGAAARAILTTDTRAKEVVAEGRGFVVGGMAKGAAMLAPNMATMLAVLTTDARTSPPVLQEALGTAVSKTFNRLSVDGATSTNDTVLVLASGLSGAVPPDELAGALAEACEELSGAMAADAEGSTKVARVEVRGAVSEEEAARAARKVAESLLVRCSLHGADPYWGRIVSELGSAGVAFDIDRVSVAYGGIEVCRGGVGASHDEAAARSHLVKDVVEISCDLSMGFGVAAVVTTDLGHGYIDENMGTS